MQYRRFGKLGWEVSTISFGAWAIGGSWGPLDDKEAMTTLHEALDSGINFIDTAQVYGDGHSERLIGKVLAERGSGERIYVATKTPPAGKMWWVDESYDDIETFYPAGYLRERVELSLRNLNVEAIDLMQLHTWTRGFNQYDEWAETYERLIEEGKLLGYGISASEKRPGDVADTVNKGRLHAIQVIYNLFEQRTDREVLAPCAGKDVATIIRVPLDEGSLTGKFNDRTKFAKGDFRRNYFGGNNLRVTLRHVEEIKKFRKERYPELTMVELALNFCRSNPKSSTVIVGIKNRDQLRQNIKVGDMPVFSVEGMSALSQFEWNRDPWTEELE